MKQNLKEALYTRIKSVDAAYLFLQNIMQDSTVYLFGGGVRDYLDNSFNFSRDLDFVVESKSTKLDISKYLADCDYISYSKNRFGGYKIIFKNDLVFDIWNLEDTWAFKTNRLPTSAENLMDSVYLNVDSLVYSITADLYLKDCDKLYAAIKKNKQIDIIYDETPFEELNLLRALVFRKKYNMTLSEKLKEKFYQQYDSQGMEIVKSLMALEISHYNSTVFSESDLITELEAAVKHTRTFSLK